MSERENLEIQEKAVIILGAGASVPYDFPTGKELFDEVLFRNRHLDEAQMDDLIKSLSSEHLEYRKRLFSDGPVLSLKRIFKIDFHQKLKLYKDSQIDYFLRTYKKTYSEYGKFLITSELANSEISSYMSFGEDLRLVDNELEFKFDEKKVDWISQFFANLIQKVKTPNDLEKISQNLTIITFNYDLVLEYCLDRFCQGDGEWGKCLENFKKKLKIIHIYGKMGRLDWEENNNIYDDDMFDNFVKRKFGVKIDEYILSKGIKVIAEKQDEQDQKHIKLAREKIKDAKKLFFFGFGFDRNNLKLLGFDGSYESKDLFNRKEVYCSIFDENEKEKILLTINDLIKDTGLINDDIARSKGLKKLYIAQKIDSLLMYL